jgi:outer membrane murein-binding lipoprotein Lpp
MPETIATIIVAVIVSGLSLAGTIIGSKAGIKEANKLTNYRIQELEKKVDKHNSVIDRTYKLEETCKLFDEKFKVANHRIDDLEGAS